MVHGAFRRRWWETVIFDFQRPLSEWVMYDTISKQPIVHGVLSGLDSRYHNQAHGSGNSTSVSRRQRRGSFPRTLPMPVIT